MAGSVVEGQLRAGMFVHVPFNSSLDMTAQIHSIEFARRQGSEEVNLCFELKPDALKLWRGLNIGDETLEITEDGFE